MKKIYSTPKVEVVLIATTQMIASSFDKNSSTAVNPNSGNVLSRGGSSWDDED